VNHFSRDTVNRETAVEENQSFFFSFKNTLWNLFFRFANRFVSPQRFLSSVPSSDELTAYTGRISLEIVSHCWQYSHLLAYHLSALINYPPKNIDVTVTVFYSTEDRATQKMLNYFAGMSAPNITWNWQALPKTHLFRRSIGRNQAALQTRADWIWYTDCDLILHKGCLDALAAVLRGRKDVLLFPDTESTTSMLEESNPILKNGQQPQLLDIDTAQFSQKKITRAVGPHQITHGDIARACGYCNNIAAYQTPTLRWRKTYEDRTYRWLLRTQGIAINIPAVYRIRHQSKGRYNKGTLWSKIRGFIRLTESKIK